MRSPFEEKIIDILKAAEKIQLNMDSIKDLPDYERGRKEGYFEGMSWLASQIRALLEDTSIKPVTVGSRCVVVTGIWTDHQGTVQAIGFDGTGTRMMAEVLIDGHDLPEQIHLQHVKGI